MTNTHINVGGHKITTNKVGTVHTVTSGFENGFTGTVQWCVTNGICCVQATLVRTSTGSALSVYTGLPKAKLGANVPAFNNRGSIYIDTNTNVLGCTVLAANQNLYSSMSYPVADDWVES